MSGRLRLGDLALPAAHGTDAFGHCWVRMPRFHYNFGYVKRPDLSISTRNLVATAELAGCLKQEHMDLLENI